MANRGSKPADKNNMAASSSRDVEAQRPLSRETRRASFLTLITTGPHSSPDSTPVSTASAAATNLAVLPGLRPSSSKQTEEPPPTPDRKSDHEETTLPAPVRHAWWHPLTKPVVQMIIAAVLAVIIGVVVAAVGADVPDAARALLGIPGDIWLRALKCIGRRISCV